MKASVFIGMSVDGFIARTNGDLDFLPPGGGEPQSLWTLSMPWLLAAKLSKPF